LGLNDLWASANVLNRMAGGMETGAVLTERRVRVPARAVPGLEAAERHLRANWRERPRLEDLAAVAGLSACHFHSLFTRHFGNAPKWLATELQMREARRLLREGVPTREVVAECGFANPSHFTMRFKRWTGLTPRQWLRRERAQVDTPSRLAS
jgi:AraC-like DNA-binding protein